MTKHLWVFMLFFVRLVSCNPTPTLISEPTLIPNTATPISPPTPFLVPTSTSSPPLQTPGPYLLITRDNKNLAIMDADGRGQKQIQLPNDGYILQLNRSVSPDGKWLAYFSGSIEEPYDIALNLLNLSDGTTRSVSNLLAPGFPENLQPIIDAMILGDPPRL